MIYANSFKRGAEVLFAAATLFLMMPLFAAIAIAIRIGDPGPVVFRQERVGRSGTPFTLLKFRSMPVTMGDHPSDRVGTVKLTWIGKALRRSNLDEVPQLLNILRGDMSLIGPRPALRSQIELTEMRRCNGSLRLRPGLTGWAQVNSFDGMNVEEKACLDGEYYQRMSFLFDVKIIYMTILYFLRPPPVY